MRLSPRSPVTTPGGAAGTAPPARPLLLDLFCGAGGAAKGYHDAGFEVVGVDIAPQPRYPYEFYQADALEFCEKYGSGFDVIHASPPCQRFSSMAAVTGRNYPDLLAPTRRGLEIVGRPAIMENVPRAPLERDWLLCGTMFSLEVIRHRAFEAVGWAPPLVLLPPHRCRNATITGTVVAFRNGGRVRAGRTRPKRCGASEFRDAMLCHWMTAHEARQAIPPAYTEFIGKQLLNHV